jgi:sugar phosphate isomerase/epimerase
MDMRARERRQGGDAMKPFRYGIACALEDVPESWPIVLRGDLDEIAAEAERLGYDSIELQLCNPQNYNWRSLKETAERHHLSICADATGRELIENGLLLTSRDAGVRRAAVDRLKLHADMCAELGCVLIEGSMRGSVPADGSGERYVEDLDAATREIADYAASKGVNVVIENITASISNYLNTVRQTTDYVRKFGRDNLGVHLDTYSMLAEENDIAGAVAYCAKELFYVHFSDSSRLYTGGGNVDFKKHMHALRAAGYEGTITVECRPWPDPTACADFCIRYMKAMETVVDIERSSQR